MTPPDAVARLTELAKHWERPDAWIVAPISVNLLNKIAADLRTVLASLADAERDAARYRAVRVKAALTWDDADGAGRPEQIGFSGILVRGSLEVAALHAAWSPDDSRFMSDDDSEQMSPEAFDVAVDTAMQSAPARDREG